MPHWIRFWPILGKWNWYNRSKYKDFWMGSSVKFVSRINGSFPPKNNGSIFFLGKKGKPRGIRGGLSNGHNFSGFFFRHPSLNSLIFNMPRSSHRNRPEPQKRHCPKQEYYQKFNLAFRKVLIAPKVELVTFCSALSQSTASLKKLATRQYHLTSPPDG